MSDNILPKGLFINKKREGSPDFVLGSLSVKRDEFVEWAKEIEVNDKGYFNIDILKSKEDKTYLKLNQWKPKTQQSF